MGIPRDENKGNETRRRLRSGEMPWTQILFPKPTYIDFAGHTYRVDEALGSKQTAKRTAKPRIAST